MHDSTRMSSWLNAPVIYPAGTNSFFQGGLYFQRWRGNVAIFYLLFSSMLFDVATAKKLTEDSCYTNLNPETATKMDCRNKGLTGTSFLISCVLFSCVLHRTQAAS